MIQIKNRNTAFCSKRLNFLKRIYKKYMQDPIPNNKKNNVINCGV